MSQDDRPAEAGAGRLAERPRFEARPVIPMNRPIGCTCQIISPDVLARWAKDASLGPEPRRSFENTAKIDVEMRRLRAQATRLSRTASLIAPANLGIVASSPAISIFDCHHVPTLPGNPVADPASSADPTIVRVHARTAEVAEFYDRVFGRNSIDDAGLALISSVHYGVQYNNAFWNGTQMAYGDGDGQIFVDFSNADDVICHELTHGVTQHSLQLKYTGEAGGLNESLSDCFGSMFYQWRRKETAAQADWLIGKEILGPEALAKGLRCLRDMADPAGSHCLAPQPSHYSQISSGMDPHESSGPPNLAFSTIARAVGGNTWDKVGGIWYDAMVRHGASPNLKMRTFADRTRSSARHLFPGDPALAAAVDAGWKKVGL